MSYTTFASFFRTLSGEDTNSLSDANLLTLVQQGQAFLDSRTTDQFNIVDNTKTLAYGAYSVSVSNAKTITSVVLADSLNRIVSAMVPGAGTPITDADGYTLRYPSDYGLPTGCYIEISTAARTKTLIFNYKADETYTVLLGGEFNPETLVSGTSSNIWTENYPMHLYNATQLQLTSVYSNAERRAELENILALQLKEISDTTSQAQDPGDTELRG